MRSGWGSFLYSGSWAVFDPSSNCRTPPRRSASKSTYSTSALAVGSRFRRSAGDTARERYQTAPPIATTTIAAIANHRRDFWFTTAVSHTSRDGYRGRRALFVPERDVGLQFAYHAAESVERERLRAVADRLLGAGMHFHDEA